jgi:spermidine synthase
MYTEYEGDIRRNYITSKEETFNTSKAKVDIITNKSFGNMLFLDGQLQLATRDEYIYHEILVHSGMVYAKAGRAQRVCIVGGADGCAAREVLKWPNVEEVHIYDWDSELVEKFKGEFSSWNSRSLLNEKVKVFCQDIRELVAEDRQYDCILIDLTDPSSWQPGQDSLWPSVLTLAKRWLAPHGSIVMNAGGIFPWDSYAVEYGIHSLAEAFSGRADLALDVYKVFVPSFAGEWCFFRIRSAKASPYSCSALKGRLRFFNDNVMTYCSTWTDDFSGFIPRGPVNLNEYLPLLHGRDHE